MTYHSRINDGLIQLTTFLEGPGITCAGVTSLSYCHGLLGDLKYKAIINVIRNTCAFPTENFQKCLHDGISSKPPHDSLEVCFPQCQTTAFSSLIGNKSTTRQQILICFSTCIMRPKGCPSH